MQRGCNVIVRESTGYIVAGRMFIGERALRESYNHWRDWAVGGALGEMSVSYARSERVSYFRLGEIFIKDGDEIPPEVLLDFVHDADVGAKIVEPSR